MAAESVLYETLKCLSSEELEDFNLHVELEKGSRLVSTPHPKATNTEEMVEQMMEKYGEECVELTTKILKRMKRSDLVQRLSGSSHGAKERDSMDVEWPTLTQRVEMVTSDIELLIETLADLSEEQLMKFKDSLHFSSTISFVPIIPWRLLPYSDHQTTVFAIILFCGQKSMKMTQEALKAGRDDLVKRMVSSSSGYRKHTNKQSSALIKKVATMGAIWQLLLEVLHGLTEEEFSRFKEFLQMTKHWHDPPEISFFRRYSSERIKTVNLMMNTYGRQSVEVTKEVLTKMNRTDLLQMLSETSTASTEEHPVDEHQPTVLDKTGEACVRMILQQTLSELTHAELVNFKLLLQFTYFQRSIPQISWEMFSTEVHQLVHLMVMRPQPVEVTKEVLMNMNRTDLIERLPATSSGSKEEHQFKLLLQLLSVIINLEPKEISLFKELLLQAAMDQGLQTFSRGDEMAGRADIVKLMVERYGQQSVMLAKTVLEKMNKTALVEMLTETSSGLRAKMITQSARLHIEISMPPLWKLQEMLEDLNHSEEELFKELLLKTAMDLNLPTIPEQKLKMRGSFWIAEMMVELYGQLSVALAKVVLHDMNRTDLVERLSETISRLKIEEKIGSRWLNEEPTEPSLQEKLLETLLGLNSEDRVQFKELLLQTAISKGLPTVPDKQMKQADTLKMAQLMVKVYGKQSEELTEDVLQMMKKTTDVVERVSGSSSKPKTSIKRQSKLPQEGTTMTPVHVKLLETLEELSSGELEKFKHVLQYTKMREGLPKIPKDQIETTDRGQTVELMVDIYGQRSTEVTKDVLTMINRTDLVEKLSESSSASEASLKQTLQEPQCSADECLPHFSTPETDSCNWTKLDPKVSSTNGDESPTYSLQSEGEGCFECRVSGLRWICKEEVSFQYQFLSWEKHMERAERLHYLPAGPLMNIKITAGYFDEVYLPHWICIKDDPKILDKFAVLHVDVCGDEVEKVSEVTPYHAKLCDPFFSPKAVMIRAGVPLKTHCSVLIYKTNTAFLTLHVYLIPSDPGLQQVMDKRESSYGYEIIRKPRPEKSLKIRDRFILTADVDGVEITPKEIKFRYKLGDPNFFEVYMKNPECNFTLRLTKDSESTPVWTCVIRKDEYQSTDHAKDKNLVDSQLSSLMQKAAVITTDRQRLFKTLTDLSHEEFKKFKWFLRDKGILSGLPCIATGELENKDRADLVDLMLQLYSQQCMDLTKKVLKAISRNDLVETL